MAAVQIKRVETKAELKTFVDFHYDLYEGNEYDVPNLFSDEMFTLGKDKNAAFDFCEAEYFLAYKDGKLAGRVAAIINHKANERWQRKSVRFGWIDFIDDIEVSAALFEAVERYGREKGMTEIIGPLGFTDFDPEGMLIAGFDQLGTMATIYNYPYYPQHMEKLGGWEKDNDYVEFKIFIPEKIPEKFAKIAQMVEKRYNLHTRSLTMKEIYKEDYGLKVFHLINATFKDLYGFSELSDRQIQQYLNMYLRWADLNLIVVIEDWNTPEHKLVGVGITLPSLSRAMQKCRRGRLLPFGWWHLIRSLKFHKTKYVDLEMVGILPEYRMKGANALLFAHLIPWYQKYGFDWGESQVEMESNEKVQSQWQYLETEQHKRRRCYIKKI
jgi:GNAT superfamily N-acetyltransferase